MTELKQARKCLYEMTREVVQEWVSSESAMRGEMRTLFGASD
jgi:hypothetical protein